MGIMLKGIMLYLKKIEKAAKINIFNSGRVKHRDNCKGAKIFAHNTEWPAIISNCFLTSIKNTFQIFFKK